MLQKRDNASSFDTFNAAFLREPALWLLFVVCSPIIALAFLVTWPIGPSVGSAIAGALFIRWVVRTIGRSGARDMAERPPDRP